MVTSIHLQESLLVLVNSHLFNNLLQPFLVVDINQPRSPLRQLIKELPVAFGILGYVSHQFFQCSLTSLRMFFATQTFPIFFKDLSFLLSLASHFKTDVHSIFLHVYESFDIATFSSLSSITSGLEVLIKSDNNLAFLDTSSPLFFPNLTRLHVRVERSLFATLTDFLTVNSTLIEINLEKNSLEDEGARALAKALKYNSTISVINLSHNSIGVDGVCALAEALVVNSTLTKINLWNNVIGALGAIILAEALKVNSIITEIDLGYNCIGDTGVKALAEALKVNSTITKVNLWNNLTHAVSAVALTEALKENSTIASISMSPVYVEYELQQWCMRITNGRITF
ncbi:hypothetical protein GEMRC1_010339 [Eukaryota sp. GEM-RC1]